MIYDCFTFFNELDLLELRFELLNDHVDWFVLSESPKTHSGVAKPLYYSENAERFKRFKHKIIHVVADDFPAYVNSWSYENYQRNALATALVDCNPEDIILISDLDEIPNLENLPNVLRDGEVICFLQKLFFYYANNYKFSHLIWEGGTKAITFRTLSEDLLNERFVKYNNHSFPQVLNKGPTLTKVRLYRNLKYILSGGWHLSYMGGVKSIQDKLSASSHQENNIQQINSEGYIIECLENGVDLLDPKARCYIVKESVFPRQFRAILHDNYFVHHGKSQSLIVYELRRLYELVKIYSRNIARRIFCGFLQRES